MIRNRRTASPESNKVCLNHIQPMSPVYLHIGTNKTGSTSIQRFLAQADHALAEQWILYPKTGRPDTNWSNQYGQHKLYWSLVGKRDIEDETVWDELRREMNEYSGHCVVVSAEGFWKCTTKEIHRIISHLNPHPIHIVVYLRPPTQFLRSNYKQIIKMGTYNRYFHKYVKDTFSRCNYLKLVSRWSQFDTVLSFNIRLFNKEKIDPGIENHLPMPSELISTRSNHL